ncbi:MAG: hypothetical protein ACLFT7_05250 [Thermoplasmata archaeon]
MKIKRQIPNPHFENCLKLNEQEKKRYGVNEDTDCSDCCFQKECSRGEFKTIKIDEEDLYKEALHKWGYEAQEKMFIEEIGEVLQAISKVDRKKNGCTVKDLHEELADLEIMLGQIKKAYSNSRKDYEEIKRNKLNRLANLLQRGQVKP